MEILQKKQLQVLMESGTKSLQVSLCPQYSVHVDSNWNSQNKLSQVGNNASSKGKTEIHNSLECGSQIE